MAYLPNYNEARSWLNDWMALASNGSEYAKRHLRNAAEEQRANLEAVQRAGGHGSINSSEYERSVTMIEDAVSVL